ncbi:MFS glucose transporter mfs1 [Lachnellula suecica]|uniref:MFS glucose transporter mfs1 n=1 Tax=Lachnellula suecica TaxID=602035 RepID=A0A8T9CKT7_9HELO|nr:MFS glucose transporter mfs1 [Lachnellula suecica]
MANDVGPGDWEPHVRRSFIARHLTILATTTIALGGITFGLDTGLIATTIAHPSFTDYMFGSDRTNNPLLGAIVATYSAGNVIGGVSSGFINNRFGRRFAMSLSSILAILGAAIQTAANGPGMMIAGRVIAGIATGFLLSTMPIYISEISPPKLRGKLVGIQGMIDAIGFFLANWVGYGGGFAKGNAQWRIPLGMQIPGALVLLILTQFLPQSPRWLAQKNRNVEARAVLERLHYRQGEAFVLSEFVQITAQVELEAEEQKMASVFELFRPQFIRRTATSMLVMSLTQFTGAGVIQVYQGILYKSLSLRAALCLWLLADKWPRVRTLTVGCLALAVELSILMALSATYGDGHSKAGSGAGIAFIFIFSASYALFFNSTAYVVSAEILPQHLRSYGMGVAFACQGISSLWLGQITPIAFAAIHWRFYAVFIALMVFSAAAVWWGIPETYNMTLEEVGAAFGDELKAGRIEDIMISSGKERRAKEELELEHRENALRITVPAT